MSDMKSIEIDFEVHQMIELERKSFSESENDALRRLLKIDGGGPAAVEVVASKPEAKPSDLKHLDNIDIDLAWISKGAVLPHGTKARMSYHDKKYEAVIANAHWIVGSDACRSPSRAAKVAVSADIENPPVLNGWLYWKVQRPGDDGWTTLREFRKT